MKKQKICKTCKHWTGDQERSVIERELRTCDYMVPFYDATDYDFTVEPSESSDWSNVRKIKEEFRKKKAFPIDGEEYYAGLLTTGDFGCVGWESNTP